MSVTLEERVAKLEKQVAELQQKNSPDSGRPAWLDYIKGRFADDPIFDKAMELGRKYRESQRPRGRKTKSKR
jgi:hypothetical protein